VDAAQVLREAGVQVRVVSVPSWELFDAQEAAYRAEVLPPAVTRRVAVEAGITQGWERYTGLDGRIIGVDHFGASAPYETLYREFGLTVEAIVEAAQTLMHA
ncbi:MAG: transketolase C-terminal domain-containing protein, partial [Bacteroidota bacterium]